MAADAISLASRQANDVNIYAVSLPEQLRLPDPHLIAAFAAPTELFRLVRSLPIGDYFNPRVFPWKK